MNKQRCILFFSIYTLALVVLPTVSTYYYHHLLGANSACDATQSDKNILIFSGLLSVVLLAITLLVAFKLRSMTLITMSAVLIPASLALSVALLILNAGCFF